MAMSWEFFVPISELDAATLNTYNGRYSDGPMPHTDAVGTCDDAWCVARRSDCYNVAM